MQLTGEYAQTYQILGQIGSGGGGTIYKAYHTRLQKEVVLKKIHEAGACNLANVRREVDILKNLRHSYLPQVLDFIVNEDGVFTVMDYIPGTSIQQILKAGHRFTEKEVVRLGTQLCEALAYLHEQRPAIIHGDIKPANVMITPMGNVCLIDFNISGISDGKYAYVNGYSKNYAAPEQIAAYEQYSAQRQMQQQMQQMQPQNVYGSSFVSSGMISMGMQNGIPVDARSDVYSLAATLFHMLTGTKITRQDGPAITKASDGLCIILNKALQIDPSKRYEDAGKMLSAFRNIYKLDKRYRKVIFRQQLVQGLFVLLIAAGVVLAVTGRHKMKQEKENRYEDSIAAMEEARAVLNEEAFEQAYEEAIGLYPNRLEPYYEKALKLYEKEDYEGVISYVENEVLILRSVNNEPEIAEVYYLLGRSYFELEAYEEAIAAYKNAIYYDDSEAMYHVEYAISLARSGNWGQAELSMEDARNRGAEDVMILLTQGEIEAVCGKYEDAFEHLMACGAQASDDYVKYRAYVTAYRAYNQCPSEQLRYPFQIDIMNVAMSELPSNYHPQLMEYQVQAFYGYGVYSGDYEYFERAITVLDQMISSGWATYNTYSNKVVMLEKCGRYEEALAVLNSIETQNLNNYAFYKRHAFLEADIQDQRDALERNYDVFLQYYQKACELYETADTPDPEMDVLDRLYEQMVNGGWF